METLGNPKLGIEGAGREYLPHPPMHTPEFSEHPPSGEHKIVRKAWLLDPVASSN